MYVVYYQVVRPGCAWGATPTTGTLQSLTNDKTIEFITKEYFVTGLCQSFTISIFSSQRRRGWADLMIAFLQFSKSVQESEAFIPGSVVSTRRHPSASAALPVFAHQSEVPLTTSHGSPGHRPRGRAPLGGLGDQQAASETEPEDFGRIGPKLAWANGCSSGLTFFGNRSGPKLRTACTDHRSTLMMRDHRKHRSQKEEKNQKLTHSPRPQSISLNQTHI